MLVLAIILAALFPIVVVFVWPGKYDHDLAVASQRSDGGPASRPSGRRPESLEGVLVAQLLGGEISGSQYRHAMAGVAGRNAVRHPDAVPPDLRPPDDGPAVDHA
jgi:hypothetical protein